MDNCRKIHTVVMFLSFLLTNNTFADQETGKDNENITDSPVAPETGRKITEDTQKPILDVSAPAKTQQTKTTDIKIEQIKKDQEVPQKAVTDRVEKSTVDSNGEVAAGSEKGVSSVVPADFPYPLTQLQIGQLIEIGCRFDHNDIRVFQNMKKNNFTTEQVVEVYFIMKGVEPYPVEGKKIDGVVATFLNHYSFTEEQTLALKRAGCTFNIDETELFRRMKLRGFLAEQAVSAYTLFRESGMMNLDSVESIATAQYLGLSIEKYLYGRMRSRERLTVGDYYNKHYAGGKGQWISGWVLTPIGAVFLGLGIVLTVATSTSKYAQSDDVAFGAGLTAVSGVVFTGGLTLLITGGLKRARRVPPWLLEEGTVGSMDQFKKNTKDKKLSSRIRVYPTASANALGMGTQVVF